MNVTKRDGRIVQFNKDKIVKALEKAFLEIDKEITEDSQQKIESIATSIEKESENKEFNVEDIPGLVIPPGSAPCTLQNLKD